MANNGQDKRTFSNFMVIQKFSGKLWDVKFAPWGDMQLNVGVDHSYQPPPAVPGGKRDTKYVGDNFNVQITVPAGHDLYRQIESGEIKPFDKESGEWGRIFFDNGGMQFTMKKSNKEGSDRMFLEIRLAPWTLVSSGPIKVGEPGERKASDPEVVTKLEDLDDIPF
jgi:hypothetical protein